MLLNTVAGGHYQERYDENAIRQALATAGAQGWVEGRGTEGQPLPSIASEAASGVARLHLTALGRRALAG